MSGLSVTVHAHIHDDALASAYPASQDPGTVVLALDPPDLSFPGVTLFGSREAWRRVVEALRPYLEATR